MLRVPLLTMISAVLLFVAILAGADVSLYSVEVGVSTRAGDLKLTVHPVFVAWANLRSVFNGVCFGNVAIIDEHFADAWMGWLVVEHEINHSRQFRSLGLAIILLAPFLDLEGMGLGEYNGWDDLQARNARMWEADGMKAWTFLTITLPPVDRCTVSGH